jgi:hypothetical protein
MKDLVISVLGNNNSSEFITESKFNLDKYKNYDIYYTSQVSERERDHSCLFYETLKTFDGLSDDIGFIFGRGCIGKGTEREIVEKVKECDPDRVFIVAKSFGVVDTLRALKTLPELNVELAIFIDGYATRISRRSVSKKYNGETRLIIPNNIKKVYNLVQREKGFKGLKAGAEHDNRIYNKVIKKYEVVGKYSGYERAKPIKLELGHKHMDEIVMTLPVFGGKYIKDVVKLYF